MAQKKPSHKLLFIDTNIFIDGIFSNSGNQILEELIKKLNDKKIVIILPEIIKMEIFNKFEEMKKGLIEKAENNLSIEKILGIDDNVKSKRKESNAGKNAKTIDGIIEKDRKKLINSINEFYKSMSTTISKLFNHKNTKIIELTDKLLLSGMRRSLLKIAPFTNTNKTGESAHTKDADCIAFESLIFHLKANNSKSKNSLIICVSDKDYHSKDGNLHTDISNDLKNFKFKSYKDLPSMFVNEFSDIQIETKQETKKPTGNEVLTLAAPTSGIEQSSIAVKQNMSGSNL